MNPLITEFYDMKLGLKKSAVAEAPQLEDDHDIVNYLANEDINYKLVV